MQRGIATRTDGYHEERAFRRGVNQAIELATRLVRSSPDLASAMARLERAADESDRLRNQTDSEIARNPTPSLIHEIHDAAIRGEG